MYNCNDAAKKYKYKYEIKSNTLGSKWGCSNGNDAAMISSSLLLIAPPLRLADLDNEVVS